MMPSRIRMGYTRRKQEGEFDFERLPEGEYSFSGKEGFVKVIVDKDGSQSWDLDNWFDSLDPDKNKEQRQQIIKDIKQRLNSDTGTINPPKSSSNSGLRKLFNL